MTENVTRIALSLSASSVLLVLAKATLIVSLALVAVRIARRTSASGRHLLLVTGFAVLLALPATAVLIPPVMVSIPNSSQVTVPTTEALIPVRHTPHLEGPPPIKTKAVSPVRISMLALFGAAWALGVLVSLVPVAMTPWHLRQLRRTARFWPQGDALARALAADTGITRPVAVLLDEGVNSPITCGLIRPAIILPAEAPRWSDEEIQRAMIHEWAHIRRADWPVHLATRVVCAVYWFHPLVWVAWRRLCLEAERACDDAVLQMAERTAYAQQLITLARRHVTSRAVPVLSMAGRSDLSARVCAVLDENQARGPLNVLRACAVVTIAIVLTGVFGPLRASSQTPPGSRQAQAAERPAFEVASVRLNTSNTAEQSMRGEFPRLTITNYPLRVLILRAYELQPFQIVGGPAWLDSDRWDILAKAPDNAPPAAARLMIQRLLEERFKLVARIETRELPIYALVPAQGDGRLGPRLRRRNLDCDALEAARGRGNGQSPVAGATQPPPCGAGGGSPGVLFGRGWTMERLARGLSGEAGRAVEDRTGLSGWFDFDLEFTPTFGSPDASALPSERPSLFTALQEQLGLKLEPRRGPVEVFVIESAERPTEN